MIYKTKSYSVDIYLLSVEEWNKKFTSVKSRKLDSLFQDEVLSDNKPS